MPTENKRVTKTTSKTLRYDSLTRDRDGKVLVIVIDGKPITDEEEIKKLMHEEVKDD